MLLIHFYYIAFLLNIQSPEDEFINAQFRCGFSDLRFPYTMFTLQTTFAQGRGGGVNSVGRGDFE
jgi:hypothetical protein